MAAVQPFPPKWEMVGLVALRRDRERMNGRGVAISTKAPD